MKGERTLYAPMRALRWRQLTTDAGPLEAPPELGAYFLPVFDTLEELREHYPDAPYVELVAPAEVAA